jgi:hypothetical protein
MLVSDMDILHAPSLGRDRSMKDDLRSGNDSIAIKKKGQKKKREREKHFEKSKVECPDSALFKLKQLHYDAKATSRFAER